MFCILVDEVEGKLSCRSVLEPIGDSYNKKHPYSITLFTTDATLFADANSSSHLDGLDRFWTRISSVFHSRMVSKITIMVVETSNMTQMMEALKTIPSGDSSSFNAGSQPDNISDEYFDNMVDDISSHSVSHRFEVIRCVNNIRQRIHDLSEAQVETSLTAPIDLRLDFMEGGSISFHKLLQKFVNESFSQSYASDSRCVHGRLCFDLPEDLDGNMCSISLDLQYTVLPHSIESLRTLDLVKDMQQITSMTSSSIKVIQAVPLASVDSSLIYGVPMSARAGLENDIDQYNEMKLLVRQLWKYLGRNELALVLQYRMRDGDDDGDERKQLNESLRRDQSEQLFLLVCESAVQTTLPSLNCKSYDTLAAQDFIRDETRKGELPCHGVLYRYATKQQILRFGSEGPNLNNEADEDTDESAEIGGEFFECIERSLDLYVKGGLNPLLT